MLFDLATATEALEDLLDHERRMILAGEIEGLAHGAQHKERLLARLAGATDGPALARIRRKAERNQALLAAAARGLKAARAQIGRIADSEPHARTYDSGGSTRDIAPATPPRGINHRA